jgi:hypothetical protein
MLAEHFPLSAGMLLVLNRRPMEIQYLRTQVKTPRDKLILSAPTSTSAPYFVRSSF